MSDNESSDLSDIPSDQEPDLQLGKKDGILKFFSKVSPKAVSKEDSPPRKKRDASPPHEYVLADNADIAFIVMFRSRFATAFPKSLPNFGPQELELSVDDAVPGDVAEKFLCALLGLLLNRKQDVKAGHYNRALEEAVLKHKSQWARDWEATSPLSGGSTFSSMGAIQRLSILRTLIMWSLASSDVIKGIITASYKQGRRDDDINQPLSVQPWGSDGDRRRYFLIEGQDDTHFRVYRESNYTGLKRTWWSVAGTIEELKALARKLEKDDGGHKAKTLSGKMLAALPRFEATEEKRKKREYRAARKQAFKRPAEPTYMYEGRTRGKRQRYTYSDEEDEGFSDATGTASRRSARNTGTHTPVEVGPTHTQSGRQVKSRHTGGYGESILSGAPAANVAEATEAGGRPRRAATQTNGWTKGGDHIETYNSVDEMSDEDEVASEMDYGDEEEDEEDENVVLESDAEEPDGVSDEDEEMDQAVEAEKKSLIIKLPVVTVVKTTSPDGKLSVKLKLTPRKPPVEHISDPPVASVEHHLPQPVFQSGSGVNALSGPATSPYGPPQTIDASAY